MDVLVPKIETDRLVLSKIVRGDLHDIFEVTSNPNVTRFMCWLPHDNLGYVNQYIQWVDQKTCSEHGSISFPWAIRLKDNLNYIGAIDFIQTSESTGVIAFMLSEAYWNRGLATEAIESVITWAFGSIEDLNEVKGVTFPDNYSAIKAMENAGFSESGVEIKIWKKRGFEARDAVAYSIFRDRF